MKLAKKLASLLLALTMLMGLTTTAFADGETGKITIDNAVVGQTYTVYQILDLESYNIDYDDEDQEIGGQYAYKAASDWSNFINGSDIKGVYVNVDAQGYVTWIMKDTQGNETGAADFAKLAQDYAKKNSVANQGTVTATAAEGSTDTTTTVTFENLDLGYYLVDSSLGTLCSLDTTNPNVTIREKNAAPTNEKTVEEDSNGSYGSVNDADIGQTVNFKSTITAQAGAQNYIFHDKMDSGLTYGSVTGITLNGTAVENTSNKAYTVSASPADGDTFDVVFTQTFCDTLKANDQIVISYTATVNENAVVGGEGNKNESKVEYGEEGKTTTTPPSTTITYTWSFDVLKYANGDENKVLADAQFVLLNKDKTEAAEIAGGKLTVWSNVPVAGTDGTIPWSDEMTLTTDDKGKITIAGLDAGTYYLREIKAPDGYNKLAVDVEVKIEPTKDSTGSSMSLAAVTAKVENKSGSELPSTGGMGTTIFYVLGGILVAGAVVLLVIKKRMGAEK